MKLSNFALSVVAMFILGVAVGTSNLVISQDPTTVINVPTNKGTNGGGFSMKLPTSLTHKQATVLSLAYDIAKRDGHKYPQLLQGILLQETNAGGLASYKVAGDEYGLKPNQRYYGVAQLKLSATRDVLSRWPELWKLFGFQTKTDEEIIAKLIENDPFNISIASKYLIVLEDAGYKTPQSLAVAYNKGAGGAQGVNPSTNAYSKGVTAHIENLKIKS